MPKENKAAAAGHSGKSPLERNYRDWFLDYSSYVILDRAIPHIDDGLKPVLRRVLHTLWEMDDGRFHKVANIVGATMRFHPHGDASIGAALVGMGQRGWLVEPQAKFPIVLLEGAEGIAVGLSTKILPHNFNDLCRAAVNHLRGKTFRIYPDFLTGGIADFSEYSDGERGGKMKVRARIEQRSKLL